MPAVTIKGIVSEIRTFKPESGWGVIHLANQRVPFTGVFPLNLSHDDAIELVGEFRDHKTYGKQFQVMQVVSHLSCERSSIKAWLILRMPNIGPKRAELLTARFGKSIWAVIERKPELLKEIDGITDARVTEIKAAYHAHSAERDHMLWLIDQGFDTKQAGEILTALKGQDIKAVVAENPYVLDNSVRKSVLPFEKLDQIATGKLKYPKHGPARVSAYVKSIMEKSLHSGDCYMVRHTLCQEAGVGLGVPATAVDAVLDQTEGLKIYGKRVLLKGIDAAEATVAKVLLELVA